MDENKTTKKLNLFGYTLESNSCTAYKTRILFKRFLLWNETSLNCIEIFKLLDESIETSIMEEIQENGKHTNNLLQITTLDLKVTIVFPIKN